MPRHHGEEDPWDVSMVGASELVMPPPHPRAVQEQADLDSSRASSASVTSTLGGRSLRVCRSLSLPLSASLCLSAPLSVDVWSTCSTNARRDSTLTGIRCCRSHRHLREHGRGMPSPSHFDALNKRRMTKLAGLQAELNNL